jgi:hypothetical protein
MEVRRLRSLAPFSVQLSWPCRTSTGTVTQSTNFDRLCRLRLLLLSWCRASLSFAPRSGSGYPSRPIRCFQIHRLTILNA